MGFVPPQINLSCLLERENGLQLGPETYKTGELMNETKKKASFSSSELFVIF